MDARGRNGRWERASVKNLTDGYAAAYVTESYAKSVLAVIETGQRLAEAKSNLPHGQWLPFVELLPFSEATARKLMQIANHPELANQSHATDLPASWYTLSVLAQLPAGEIETRIAAGELTPETPRHQAEEWARIYQMGRQEAVNAWSEYSGRTPEWAVADADAGVAHSASLTT